MEQISYSYGYQGKNVREWKVKEYTVTENFGKWLCTCALKYKRNPKITCKHITIAKTFLNRGIKDEL